MDVTIPLLVVIVSGSIALATALLVARRSERHERRNLLLSKLQDLHVAVDVTLGAHIESFTGAMAHLRYGTRHGTIERPAQLETVHAIVGLYFPEIDAEYAALVTESNTYVPLILDALLKRPPTEQEQVAACHKLTEVSTRVHQRLRAVQARAVDVARTLVPGKEATMNGGQRVTLVIASVAAAIMLAAPPWVVRTPGQVIDLDTGKWPTVVTRVYADILHQPPRSEIDSTRLAIQLLMLAALTSGATLALGARRGRR